MTDTTRERWVLDHQGRHLEVEGPPSRTTRHVRLFADGEQVAQDTIQGKRTATLTHDGLTVRAEWDKAGHLAVVTLLPGRGDLEDLHDLKDLHDVKDLVTGAGETWFTPPPGSRAERRERRARRHPRLFAARHVAAAVAKVLFPLLGITALIRIPKPGIDLPGVDLPDLPDLPRLRIPWPDIDMSRLPDLTLPGWIQAIVHTAKYWGPILGAVLIALREYERRKKQREKAAQEAGQEAGQKSEETGETGDAVSSAEKRE